MSSSTPTLLRCVRDFRKAFEQADGRSLFDAEFADKNGRVDLRPSVYRLDTPDEFVRAYVEHCANAPRDPNNAAWARRGYDVRVCAPSIEEERLTTCGFSFIATRHCVVPCSSEGSVLAFATALAGCFRAGTTRTFKASTNELREYLKGRAGAQDPEWGEIFRIRQTFAKLAGLPNA